MVSDPGTESHKTTECPFCKEPSGQEHKKTCGMWSPYSNSKWLKPDKPAPAAITVARFGTIWASDAEGRN